MAVAWKNLMSSAISIIPRYHPKFGAHEMDVRCWPIEQPPPATVIDAVSAIFEVMRFLMTSCAIEGGIINGKGKGAMCGI